MKKIIALLLACVMVLGLFAACGAKTETPAASGNTQTGTTQTGSTGTTNEAGVPTITWYTVGGGNPANWESWTAKVNEYLATKGLNINLNLQVIGWGDWGERRNVLVQTGADYDIMFAPGGDFVNDTNMNACAPLDDLLAQTPGLTSTTAWRLVSTALPAKSAWLWLPTASPLSPVRSMTPPVWATSASASLIMAAPSSSLSSSSPRSSLTTRFWLRCTRTA